MRWLSRPWLFMTMVAPALLVYSVFMVYPVFYSVFYSFTDYNGVASPKVTGLANYHAMVGDQVFWTALRNTGIILAFAVVILVPLGFLIATLLSGGIRGSGAMRALVFAPAIVAPILVGMIWIFILDPKIGLINAALAAMGVPTGPQWIGGTHLSPYSIASVYVWQQVGFMVTIFYAGVRMLPNDVMEASALDVRNRYQQMRYIVVPMLQETFGIATALAITGAFKVFELVFVLTGGGPIHLSDVLASYMYYVTFSTLRYSYGMTIAVVIFVLGALASLVSLRLVRRRGVA